MNRRRYRCLYRSQGTPDCTKQIRNVPVLTTLSLRHAFVYLMCACVDQPHATVNLGKGDHCVTNTQSAGGMKMSTAHLFRPQSRLKASVPQAQKATLPPNPRVVTQSTPQTKPLHLCWNTGGTRPSPVDLEYFVVVLGASLVPPSLPPELAPGGQSHTPHSVSPWPETEISDDFRRMFYSLRTEALE